MEELKFLEEQQVNPKLLQEVEAFRKEYGDPGGDRGQIKARQRGGRRD